MIKGIVTLVKCYFNTLSKPRKARKNLPHGAFEPLTPVLMTGEQVERYEGELLHALQDEQVRNIAVTGSYGAGKSSVIRTFFDRNPEFKSALVSLATFSKDGPVGEVEGEANTSKADTDPELMPRIEETIVQQLLYAVPAGRLPKTRFKRIVQASNWRIFARTLFFALLFASGLRLYLPSVEVKPKIDPDWLIPKLMMIPDILALVYALGAALFMLYAALKFLSLFSIDGLTLKGGKLEATHHGSVLHKHVDEIIYCFQRSDISVVVIEDLDRFGIQDVFFRLREINFTINHSPEVRRPVHFIYAIRDELFSVGDKTKFFDLIIPVIPVVNSENSREKMMDLLKAPRFDASMINRLDSVLIETVCYYIDEMRLIKNIVNEFDMLSSQLRSRGVDLEANKLFAMVVVRNLYPEAYADLSKRRGAIYSVFQDFGDWRKAHASQTDEHITNVRQHLVELEQEHLGSVEELRMCVWYQIVKVTQSTSVSELTYDANSTVTLGEFLQDETFEEIFKTNRSMHMQGRDHRGLFYVGKSAISDDVLLSTNYRERSLRLGWGREKLASEIEALSTKSSLTKRMPFRVAAKRDYGEVIAQKLKGLDAMVYLMRAGYFDTDYSDYLGFFYEGSLTQNDKNLILALRRGESPDVMAAVNDPAKVISKLDHEALEDGRGLIAGLVDYLCSQYQVTDSADMESRADDPVAEKLLVIFASASRFIERFAETVDVTLSGHTSSALIQAIYHSDPELFKGLLTSSTRFKDGPRRQVLLCATLSSLTNEQVEVIENGGHGVLDSLRELADVTQVVPLLAEGNETWGWLRKQPVQFNNLSDTTAADDLKRLVSWGCVAPRLEMLQLICSTFEEVEDGKDSLVTYHRLLALHQDGVEKLLLRHPSLLVEQLLSQDGVLEESSESLGELLTAIGGNSEQVSSLLERTACQFTALDGVPERVWPLLLDSGRVTEKTEVVWTYFLRFFANTGAGVSLDLGGRIKREKTSLNTFIERNVDALVHTLWTRHSDHHHLFQMYLLRETIIPNAILMQLFSSITLKSTEILRKIPSMRWDMLIASSFLPYSAEVHQIIHYDASEHEAEYLKLRGLETDQSHVN